MSDKPIIFSAPMVRALLDGRKTQTRRLLKPQPYRSDSGRWWSFVRKDGGGCHADDVANFARMAATFSGYHSWDRLYVREHWKTSLGNDGVPPRELDPITAVHFFADGAEIGRYPTGKLGKLRQGMHMPRWASRLTLIVTDVRVQRLQEISEADAIAEGVTYIACVDLWSIAGFEDDTAQGAFRLLWNSIYTTEGGRWEDNPWIVAVSFEVVHGNIDRPDQ